MTAVAQEQKGITFSGSIQSDWLVPQNDEATGAVKTDDLLTNTYVDLQLQSSHVDAGARLEYLEHPLPGFENDFKGWGVPHFWVKGRLGCAELTAGTFYEQFGSGFILRTYEERSLGIDNSILGGRLVIKPLKGLTLKALSGKQRHYWKWDGGLVSGLDGEVALDEWISSLQQHNTRLTLGASHKTQDPSFDNGYNYHSGQVAMLSTSYSQRGLSLLLQAKRSENMSFRSKRNMLGTSLFINHLPAFTLDHTYALAALYPYATQLATGEWAYQAEVGYNIPRKTALGGKYGMNVKLNYSYVRAIDSQWLKWGDDTYYQDLNVQLTRRMTRDIKLSLMYMNQRYNQEVIEGHGDMIHSNIFVADAMFQLARHTKLRTELQYLTTRQDQHDWAYALAELSLAPRWMFTISDLWNCGETNTHYYQGLVTCTLGSHRLQVGYGRTRAGYNCSGGVCRYVPATKGFSLSYNYNF